ncbi:MAG: radical SAM protein [Acidobacteria bacterium]|nr:radical SAM protein [Acidobacteriota bacterium]
MKNRKTSTYIDIFNNDIKNLFKNAIKITLKNPSQALFFLRSLISQKKAAGMRRIWDKKGIHVPPFLIYSITNRCNLKCAGCYMHAHKRHSEQEMERDKIEKLLSEARELGSWIVLIAGGEPFVRNDLLEIIGMYPEITFPVFTNGMLLNRDTIRDIKQMKNLVPVISIEGFKNETDFRRGSGVFEHLQGVFTEMKKQRLFWGISLTATRSNFDIITGDEFLSELIGSGCQLFFFVEYVPIEEKTEHLILEESQRAKLIHLVTELKSRYPGLFITLPGDEEDFGGCLAAGRGFIHISPSGNVEPCPFAPYTADNLENMSLKEALNSEFLKKIQENHEYLSESEGGCALWTNREWVKSLIG